MFHWSRPTRSREEYFGLIDRAGELKVTEAQKRQVVHYLYALEHYRHTYVGPVEHKGARPIACWNSSRLRWYLSGVDEGVSRVVDQVLG